MLFGEIVIVALQSIRANLFRATLTMLGIIIGVGAVITMLAAGAGAQKRIDDQIASLGANILTINASNFFAGGVSRDRQTLIIDDADALSQRRPLPRRRRARDAEPRPAQARQPEHERAAHRHDGRVREDLQLQARAWADSSRRADEEQRRRVVVLGAEIPERLETEPGKLLGKHARRQRPAVRGHRHLREHRRRLRQPEPRLRPRSSRCGPRSSACWAAKRSTTSACASRTDASMERAMVDIERVLRRAAQAHARQRRTTSRSSTGASSSTRSRRRNRPSRCCSRASRA